ncbi:MAG: hypothetical protein ACPG1A_14420 [Halioglobus sp.]
MDKAEARALAQASLATIASDGYGAAAEHVDTVHLDQVTADSGTHYEMETSYLWKGEAHEDILVICRITSKHWFSHEHLEESITLHTA